MPLVKTIRTESRKWVVREIRAHQPWCENPLCPCMIIDNPHCLRNLVRRQRPTPTHEGAECILNELAPFLDDYGQRYRRLARDTWNEEYAEDYGRYL